MEVMKIMLDTLEKVKNFTEDAEKCNADMDLILCGCPVDPGSLQPGEKPAFDAEDIRGLSGISQCEEENGKVPGGVNKCIFE